ncbi:MAG: iron-sulfur cluster assembly protein [Candidatus Thorarchaeota archaeon]
MTKIDKWIQKAITAGFVLTTVEEVFESLKPVMDPEHPISIIDERMKIVEPHFIRIIDDLIRVRFKPTIPTCPMGGLIGILIRHQLEKVFPENKVHVLLLPESHSQEDAVNSMISDDERYDQIIEQLKDRVML